MLLSIPPCCDQISQLAPTTRSRRPDGNYGGLNRALSISLSTSVYAKSTRAASQKTLYMSWTSFVLHCGERNHSGSVSPIDLTLTRPICVAEKTHHSLKSYPSGYFIPCRAITIRVQHCRSSTGTLHDFVLAPLHRSTSRGTLNSCHDCVF